MTETLSQKELAEWSEKLFGNAKPGSRREAIHWAGMIANESGKRVPINNMTVSPNKPQSFDWGIVIVIVIGIILLAPWIMAGVSLLLHGHLAP